MWKKFYKHRTPPDLLASEWTILKLARRKPADEQPAASDGGFGK